MTLPKLTVGLPQFCAQPVKGDIGLEIGKCCLFFKGQIFHFNCINCTRFDPSVLKQLNNLS